MRPKAERDGVGFGGLTHRRYGYGMNHHSNIVIPAREPESIFVIPAQAEIQDEKLVSKSQPEFILSKVEGPG